MSMIQFIVNIVLSLSFNLLAGIAVSLVYLPTGCFPISLGFMALAGAYSSWIMEAQIGLVLALLISLLASALIGLLSEVVVLGPLRRGSKDPGLVLVASLGFFTIGIHSIAMIFGDDVKSFAIHTPTVSIFSAAYLTVPQFTIFLAAFSFYIVLIVFIQYTGGGRKLLAVSYQPILARIYGLQPERIRAIAVMVGSSIAGLTASLVSWDTGLEPSLGFSMVVAGAVTMIVSGIGEPRWLLLGALLVAFINNLAALLIGAMWMQAISFFVMILFLLFRPFGMSGRPLRKNVI